MRAQGRCIVGPMNRDLLMVLWVATLLAFHPGNVNAVTTTNRIKPMSHAPFLHRHQRSPGTKHANMNHDHTAHSTRLGGNYTLEPSTSSGRNGQYRISKRAYHFELPGHWTDRVPLKVTNRCPNTIWPGLITAHGSGPGLGGFELLPDYTMDLYVGSTWQGRVWGRTNCSFNEDGTGPSNLNGVAGVGMSCLTGDCFGQLDCASSGAVPSTLAEFTLAGGDHNTTTFYDISLVDGYNLPVAINHLPALNTSHIPLNSLNIACIATAGYLSDPEITSHTFLDSTVSPLETIVTNKHVSNWCPWELQAFPPTGPVSGVYPYPDDDLIQRAPFSPCLSACARSNLPWDCCTNDYDTPEICKPGEYSKAAKQVCPDAYSFAYDDKLSTFTVPRGGGWEVVFCPEGRSTNVANTFGVIMGQKPEIQFANVERDENQIIGGGAGKAGYDTKPSKAMGSQGTRRPVMIARVMFVASLMLTTTDFQML